MAGFSLLGSLSCSSPLIWQGAHWISEQPIRMLMLPDPLLQNPVCRSTPSPTEALKADIRSQPWKRVRFGYPPLIVLSGWVLPVTETCGVSKHRFHDLPQAPLHSASAGVCLKYCLQWSYGPILLPQSLFKMLPLWTEQAKPTQTNHAGNRCWEAWAELQLPRDSLQDYSISLTWLHVSAGSQPHHWSTSPAHPRRANGGAAWNLASSSTLVLLATGCTHIYIRP